VARQAGHAPEDCLRTYANTFEEFDPADRMPAAEAVRRARERALGPNVRSLYAFTPKAEAPEPEFWLYDWKPTAGLEPATSSLRERCSTN
jgi:hypothetical protein